MNRLILWLGFAAFVVLVFFVQGSARPAQDASVFTMPAVPPIKPAPINKPFPVIAPRVDNECPPGEMREHPPAQQAASCPCSEGCSCGCQQGQGCPCGQMQVMAQPVRLSPALVACSH